MEQKLTDIMKQAFQREQETILATGEWMDPEAFERPDLCSLVMC